jgi:hypothetical protein
MASKKFKLTGFARFLLVMVVLAPLAFLGASYYNGEDGIENLKNLFKGNFNFGKKEVVAEQPEEKTDESKALVTQPSEVEINSQVAKLQDELDFKTQKVDSLYKENATLKSEIKAKDKELSEVKDQLEKIKSAISQ